MGFSKKYLPELKELKNEYKTLGHDRFVEVYSKYNMLIGEPDATHFVEKTLNKKIK